MDTLQAIILALIQGVTEFLPISSSAHLILPAQLFGWPDQGIAFDVAVHVGSLLAVTIYFRQDVLSMSRAWLQSLSPCRRQPLCADGKLAWMVLLAVLPVMIVGLFTKDFIEEHLRSTIVIAVTTLFFAVLLGLADLKSRRQNAVLEITWRIAILIGLAQVLALIPGTSRSGVTITVAVLLGLSKTDAARFSFLLSIPIIMVAGGYAVLEMLRDPPVFSWMQLALGVAVSAVSAYLCIEVFLKLLERVGFMPFVWYRLGLGVVLLALI